MGGLECPLTRPCQLRAEPTRIEAIHSAQIKVRCWFECLLTPGVPGWSRAASACVLPRRTRPVVFHPMNDFEQQGVRMPYPAGEQHS